MSLFVDDELKPKKTTRILVYPNITFGKDLEKNVYFFLDKVSFETLFYAIF